MGQLVEIALEHGGVEQDAQPQPARPADVSLADCVERLFGLKPLALLRQVHMKGHIIHPGGGQTGQKRTAGTDAVCHQAGSHA